MALKNWLIRTTQNQLLGPVSKEKIIELIRAGKLEEDDEVCSGNGYWFYIRENDLVEKYLIGDIPQTFNPVYENEPVLNRQERKNKTSTFGGARVVDDFDSTEQSDTAVLPENDDLEYPDIEINDDVDIDDDTDDDITVVGMIPELPSENENLRDDVGLMSRVPEKFSEESARPGKLPCEEDLSYPDLGMKQDSIDEHFESLNVEGGQEEDDTAIISYPNTSPVSDDELDKTEETLKEISNETHENFKEQEKKIEGISNINSQEVNNENRSFEDLPKKQSKGLQQLNTKKSPSSEKVNQLKPKKRTREFAEKKDASSDDVINKALRDKNKQLRRRGVDTYLILFFGSLIMIIFAVIFYYKFVLKKSLPFIGKVHIFSPVYAQTVDNEKKKV